ncbi:ATP-binding protein [Micromonospora sp. NPDC048898]|uniref:ATP-binding protein n=1 Tax=Micromonospora sp. NPDC048898 TaxID=3364260 RepID=UPI00371474D3
MFPFTGLKVYLRPHVLVMDEVGYRPLERDEANFVFQLISKRYEEGSTLLASNKSFSASKPSSADQAKPEPAVPDTASSA